MSARRLLTAIAAAAVALSTAVLPVSPAAHAAGGDAAEPARFLFWVQPYKDTFVVELTDPALIEHARRVLSGEETVRTHIGGVIVTEPASYNTPWSYHLDPGSVVFFFAAIEVCDATIGAVEENLKDVGGAFLPNNEWCPWGSQLLEEIPVS